MRRVSILAALAMVAACGSSQSIPVKGETSDTVVLAGDWEGTYTGIDSGRMGKIHFSLEMGRHTAEGNVAMFPKGSDKPHILSIRFVEVEGGQIQGKIDPYIDPQCECQVETEFLGKLDGEHIDGTFTTRVVGTDTTQKGTWSVMREHK